MDRRVEIIDLLLKLTIRISEAIKHQDIEMVKATIEQRELLLTEYNSIEKKELEPAIQDIADRIIQIDQENNELLSSMVEKERVKFQKVSKDKNYAKKRTSVAKKYVAGGTSIGEYSKFNKKT